MNQALAGIAAGILSLHFWPQVPGYLWFVTALMIGGFISSVGRFKWISWVVVGALIAKTGATAYLEAVEMIPLERQNITIAGEVSSLLNQNIPIRDVEFTLDTFDHQPLPLGTRLRVRLEWPQAPPLKLGQRWQLEVRLKRPYGRVNQAGFDAERYFLAHGLHGRGLVIQAQPLAATAPPAWRQQLFDQVTALTQALNYQPYLLALSFGFRDGLTRQDWLILRDSGLAHLMAISGLHIGLAVGCGWWLGRVIRGLSPEHPRLLWLPMWLALLLAFSYAWLAGFSLPTQRALLTCLLVLGLIRFRVQWPGWQVMLVALVLCLVLNPLGSYGAGFWLSFAAVWVLYCANLAGVQPRPVSQPTRFQTLLGRFKSLALMQGVLLLLMLPVQWQWFGGISLVAPVVNFLAVPWVSLVTVPLVLAALATLWLPTVSGALWWLADRSLVPVLALAAQAEGAWWDIPTRGMVYLLGGIFLLVVMWFVPIRRHKAWFLVVALVMAGWYGRPGRDSPLRSSVSAAAWQVDMLDVGHGLALLIRRNGRAVLYDTGNRWEQGSIANAVIEPVLRRDGITRLDGLILSHADSDHAGGVADVLSRLQPIWRRSSDHRAGFAPCVRGEAWQWQQLDFRVLWPPKRVARAANPHSCVIEIQDAALSPESPVSVLLTGDIDAISELLLARLEPSLKPDILLVPHHGSKTSSTATWLATMQPDFALVSAARYSPWQLPSPTVRQRYLDQGAQWLNTAAHGQVTAQIDQGVIAITRYRQDVRGGWFRAVGSGSSPEPPEPVSPNQLREQVFKN
ncbi:DNA internalization-related competence protein ComEC/Rec2 [Photobacterium sp. TY1-4]|uniref:DNA internalization-related competence protein ComEC/Rec2 n=1 Tax=Photobacterium sp. TY1-4 TaxID=2899122 RepID=UPI0021BF8C2D|nr:DNA internalization-related competence protein ComEC/Rec2 [Photobacterium sp. TY1-4]UXI02304.1 DNA internalization-related competence protein ComEC/Rec2 [Photobacterium sp. TY1-4]